MVSWWFGLGRGRIYPLGCCCIIQRTWPQKSVWLLRFQQNNKWPIWKAIEFFEIRPMYFAPLCNLHLYVESNTPQKSSMNGCLCYWTPRLPILLHFFQANSILTVRHQNTPLSTEISKSTTKKHFLHPSSQAFQVLAKSLGFKYFNTMNNSLKLAGPAPLGGASLHPRSEHCTPRPLPDP